MPVSNLSARLQNIFGWLLLAGSTSIVLLLLFWPQKHISLPIVDVQMHYNSDAWQYFSTKAIVGTLRELSVARAVVSSTPNDGTFRLMEEGPLLVVPMFTPYRTRDDRDDWFENPEILAYMEREVRRWDYRGIGEFHLFDGQLHTPVVRRMVELAIEYDLILLAHSDPRAIRELFAMGPRLKIVWAHAGMTAPPEQIAEMLDAHPNLWAELSHRTDIAPDGTLAPAWDRLFLRHPNRFMVGSGTYSNEYWYQFRYMLQSIRNWLDQLPPEVAERIAYKNATDLFARN